MRNNHVRLQWAGCHPVFPPFEITIRAAGVVSSRPFPCGLSTLRSKLPRLDANLMPPLQTRECDGDYDPLNAAIQNSCQQARSFNTNHAITELVGKGCQGPEEVRRESRAKMTSAALTSPSHPSTASSAPETTRPPGTWRPAASAGAAACWWKSRRG